MTKPCAKQGDQIVAVDIHLYPGSPPVPGPHPYTGIIQMKTHPTINVMGMPSATVGTKSMNTPPHAPAVDGPNNIGEIVMGSTGVKFNNQMVGRLGDIANTCQVSGPAPLGQVVCAGTVLAGEVGVAVVVVTQQPIQAQAAQMNTAEAVQITVDALAAAAALQKIWSDLSGGAAVSAQSAAADCSAAASAVNTALQSGDPSELASAVSQAQDAIDAAQEVIQDAEEAEDEVQDRSAEYMRIAQRASGQAAILADRAASMARQARASADRARSAADELGPLQDAADSARSDLDAATQRAEAAQASYDAAVANAQAVQAESAAAQARVAEAQAAYDQAQQDRQAVEQRINDLRGGR